MRRWLSARARRGSRPAAQTEVTPTSSNYWGSYEANPAFSIAGLPATIQTYTEEAQFIWNGVWSTSAIAGYTGVTLQGLSSDPNVYIHRAGVPHAFGVADIAWMTGNPAYLTHAESYVTNLCAVLIGANSIADIFGGRMANPAASSHDPDWTGVRLNEPNLYVCLALYTRLLHENGVNPALVATATTRLQEHWRRYQRGAWLDGSTPTVDWHSSRTPAGSASLTHADVDPLYRNFTHPLSAIAATAWTLYKMTGNTNYHTGFTGLIEHLGLGIGYEQSITPERATFVHMPNNSSDNATLNALGYEGQPIEYANHGLPALAHYLDRENAWVGTWPFGGEVINRGVAYYAFRDSGSFSDQPRRDVAGAGYELPIVTTPFTAGGVHHALDGSFTIENWGTGRYAFLRPYPSVIPYSDWYRTWMLARRAADHQAYWNAPGNAAGLIEYEVRELA